MDRRHTPRMCAGTAGSASPMPLERNAQSRYKPPAAPVETRVTSVPFAAQVCLSMIVKDEAPVIARCLASVREAIGAWAIVDTGSTDDTIARVHAALEGLPGVLAQRPWVDFATNRNQALELAFAQADYALVIDADEVLEIAADAAWPARLDAAGYLVRQRLAGSEFEYRSAKLLRRDAGWRWHGVLHEYPAAGDAPLVPLDGLSVLSHPDGARSRRPLREKFLADARVLEAALAAEPEHRRYRFYLAQSLRDAGETAAALDAYRTRAAQGGWDEEVWYSTFQVAVLLERLGAPAPEVIDAYLAAYDRRPTRAEPLCELARYLRLAGRYASAHAMAMRAAKLPQPADLLFIDASVYRWRARDEQAISAWHSGDKGECARLCRDLLADPRLPADQRERIARNLAWC